MLYTLFHRDVPVIKAEFSDGRFLSVQEFYDISHAPVGCLNQAGAFDASAFALWWQRRQLPVTRENWDAVFASMDGVTREIMAFSCFAASLSDQYWLCPEHVKLTYKKVNFFENRFSSDSRGLFLTDQPLRKRMFDLCSPSCVTGGDVPKAWQIVRQGCFSKRLLFKAGVIQGCCEVIASELAAWMGVPRVRYDLTHAITGQACGCVCACAVDKHQDFVPACDFFAAQHVLNTGGISDYELYIELVERAGVASIRVFMETQIVIDFLMQNVDRHWGNFGLLRDARTLKYCDVMPLFDTGKSLFFPGNSKLTSMELFHDLRLIRGIKPDVIRAVYKFPDITERIFASAGFPAEKVASIRRTAYNRSRILLHYFDAD